jgi:hypothetical protein
MTNLLPWENRDRTSIPYFRTVPNPRRTSLEGVSRKGVGEPKGTSADLAEAPPNVAANGLCGEI